MARRIAPVAVVTAGVLAACGAMCQKAFCQKADRSFPDAPSAQIAIQPERFNVFAAEEGAPLRFVTMGSQAGMMRRGWFSETDKAAFAQKDPNAIFRKYLYPSSASQQSGYHSVNNTSLMRRASYAASRPLITRDYSGKSRLNTSYILRTLTTVAKDTASTPYWKRSLAEPFSDFGSTVGNDAGMNLWHEFGPSIQQLMKSHTPKFVIKVENRIGLQ
jgi:hypothetical protein